jgi:predicted  nucleic acid-binding Zn-ribbon protein
VRQKPTTVIRMPRPTWTPKTDRQRQVLAELEEAAATLAQVRRRAEAKLARAEAALTEVQQRADVAIQQAADAVMEVVKTAREVKVPVREVISRTGGGRATLYRRIGKKKP